MPITRADVEILLKPGARKIIGTYDKMPSEWKEIFKKEDSKMADEWEPEMRYFGYGQFKQEGGAFARDDNAGQRFVTRYHHQEFGLEFAMTRPMVDDNLYKKEFPKATTELRNSMDAYKNLLTATFIINGFPAGSIGTNTSTMADGQTIFSTAHPTDFGTYSNYVGAGLNETSVEQAMILSKTFIQLSGVRIPAKIKKLIVGPELDFIASRLTESTYRVQTGNNDVNPVVSTRVFPEGYQVNSWFNITGQKPWIILTNINETSGFTLMQRIPLEENVHVEETTQNIITNVYERYSYNIANARASIGGYSV
jgi:hypothetical protein